MKPVALQRILIIDDSEDVEVLVRFCAQASWPEAVLEMYDPRCGLPEVSFNCSRYVRLLTIFWELHVLQQPDISIMGRGYTITKKIGEGVMVSIYLAERHEDNLK